VETTKKVVSMSKKIEISELAKVESLIKAENARHNGVLTELNNQRDIIVGKKIAKETYQYPNINEHEALGYGLRIYGFSSRGIVIAGYRQEKDKLAGVATTSPASPILKKR